jgi:hypothetical protein
MCYTFYQLPGHKFKMQIYYKIQRYLYSLRVVTLKITPTAAYLLFS